MNKVYGIVLIGILLSGALCAGSVVEKGQVQFSGVVVNADAPMSVNQAAKEIVHCFRKATGKEIPVIFDKDAVPGRNYLYLGATKKFPAGNEIGRKKNQGVIIVAGKNIFIAGKDDAGNFASDYVSTGTLFAAYEFLEKYLGVRWLWPGELGEFIPAVTDLNIADGRYEFNPRLESSQWRRALENASAWSSAGNREKFLSEQSLWLKHHRFSVDRQFQYGHAFTDYWVRYGKTHPEFFNLLPDGTRRSNPYDWSHGAPHCVSLCVTCPGLINTIVANWVKSSPRQPTINLNENDTGGECVCKNCLLADNSPDSPAKRLEKATQAFKRKKIGWENELGSLSDRYCHFFLEVQKEADKIDKQHRIMGLIYANYSLPPSEKIKLNDRIVLRFCPPYMYPWTDEKIAEYRQLWHGWARSGAKLMFRPNFTLDGAGFPIQYQEVFYDLFTFSAKDGMIASDMDSLTGHFATQGLVNYVIASVNHDRDSSLATLKNDFFSAFGAAKQPVKEYFDYVELVTMKSGFKSPFKNESIEGGLLDRDLFLVADTLFTPEVMKNSEILLQKARQTPGLDPVSAKRVDFLLIGLKNVQLTMKAQEEFRQYQKNKDVRPFAQAVRRLDNFRASVETTNGLNVGNLRYLEDRHWPSRLKLKMAESGIFPLSGWTIKWDPQNKGVEQRFFDATNAEGWVPISTDSHWERQPAGIAWEKQYGAPYKGVAWYRNIFRLEPGRKGIKLDFSAVDGSAVVYLNGKVILERPYPYRGDTDSWRKPFSVDIAAGVKPGDNVLAIRIEKDSNKYSGLRGIWRDVYLSPQ